MNPTNKEVSGTQPPASPVEQAAAAVNLGETAAAAPAAPETAPALQPAAPAAAAPAPTIPLPLPLAPAAPAAPAPSAAAQSSTLAADDDNDLIEKEWVDKAKQIVERTRDDPYKQSEELTVFKADYMKKRYDKTIKLSQ